MKRGGTVGQSRTRGQLEVVAPGRGNGLAIGELGAASLELTAMLNQCKDGSSSSPQANVRNERRSPSAQRTTPTRVPSPTLSPARGNLRTSPFAVGEPILGDSPRPQQQQQQQQQSHSESPKKRPIQQGDMEDREVVRSSPLHTEPQKSPAQSPQRPLSETLGVLSRRRIPLAVENVVPEPTPPPRSKLAQPESLDDIFHPVIDVSGSVPKGAMRKHAVPVDVKEQRIVERTKGAPAHSELPSSQNAHSATGESGTAPNAAPVSGSASPRVDDTAADPFDPSFGEPDVTIVPPPVPFHKRRRRQAVGDDDYCVPAVATTSAATDKTTALEPQKRYALRSSGEVRGTEDNPLELEDSVPRIDLDGFATQHTQSQDPAQLPILVYLPGDAMSVTLVQEDVDRLRPDTFLNDSLIEFYLRYLERNVVPEDQRGGYHFFNTFFFKKLATTQQRILRSQLQRWTRGVDVFSKKFLFIPINEHEHWSLAVVCLEGGVFEEVAKPCILFLDSLSQGSTGISSKKIRSWLCSEHKASVGGDEGTLVSPSYVDGDEGNGDGRAADGGDAFAEGDGSSSPRKASRGRQRPFTCETMPVFAPRVPRQQNLSDCGVFLLHYTEMFVTKRPRTIEAFEEWFDPSDVDKKRGAIRDLIARLQRGEGSLPPVPMETGTEKSAVAADGDGTAAAVSEAGTKARFVEPTILLEDTPRVTENESVETSLSLSLEVVPSSEKQTSLDD